MGALAATTTTDTPLGVRDVFVFIECEERVVEPVRHLVNDTCLGPIVELRKRWIVCRLKDGKRSLQIVRSMGENKGACVNITQSKV